MSWPRRAPPGPGHAEIGGHVDDDVALDAGVHRTSVGVTVFGVEAATVAGCGAVLTGEQTAGRRDQRLAILEAHDRHIGEQITALRDRQDHLRVKIADYRRR